MDVYVYLFLGALDTFRHLGDILHASHMEIGFFLVRMCCFGGALSILKEGVEPTLKW